MGWMRLSTQLRRDHDRQALGEVAQHLERRRAGAEDHRGPQHRRSARRWPAGSRRPRCASPGAAERSLALGVEAAEVDDPADAGARGRRGEDAGRVPVARPRTRAPVPRAWIEVVGDVDALAAPRPATPGRWRRPRPPRRSRRARAGRAAARGGGRARARRSPASSSSGTRRPPMYPVAPVTSTSCGSVGMPPVCATPATAARPSGMLCR